MKRSEEYFNENIEPHLHSTYLDDYVRTYGDMRVQEYINQLRQSDADKFIEEDSFDYNINRSFSTYPILLKRHAKEAIDINSQYWIDKAVGSLEFCAKMSGVEVEGNFLKQFKQQLINYNNGK